MKEYRFTAAPEAFKREYLLRACRLCWARIFVSCFSAPGHEVICLDNFSTGLRRNIAPLSASIPSALSPHDVVEPIDLEVDEIYNLACPASPPHYQADRSNDENLRDRSLNLLDLARVVAPHLPGSTSEIYGDPHVTLRWRAIGQRQSIRPALLL